MKMEARFLFATFHDLTSSFMTRQYHLNLFLKCKPQAWMMLRSFCTHLVGNSYVLFCRLRDLTLPFFQVRRISPSPYLSRIAPSLSGARVHVRRSFVSCSSKRLIFGDRVWGS